MAKNTGYVVTRQNYYYSGLKVVEIASGGIDGSGPDALCQKYAGEFTVYADPREAAQTAIEIARQWRKDAGKRLSYVSKYICRGAGNL